MFLLARWLLCSDVKIISRGHNLWFVSKIISINFCREEVKIDRNRIDTVLDCLVLFLDVSCIFWVFLAVKGYLWNMSHVFAGQVATL